MTVRSCPFIALASLTLLAAVACLDTAIAAGTAFTYQGQLQQGGIPVSNGVYDFTFSLFATNAGGTAVAGPGTNLGVGVTNGLFTVLIDFGSAPFTGASNWVEIAVETNSGAGFTTLAPRVALTPVPTAIFAENVNTSAVTNLNVSTSGGTASLGSLLTTVVINGASTVTLGSLIATNYLYVARWVTNAYNISTNDTLLFCWGTNELLTLPATAPMGKMFTVFSKNPNGSVILTNGSSSQVITVPGLGQNPAVYLGASTSASNVVTVTFDGANY